MAKSIITPEEGAELQRLNEEFEVASARAAKALLVGNRQLASEEDAKAAAAIRRIKEIRGE
ncbi:hypothetical protein [Methylocella tundrae]|uniref:Uncharacterized protein n=1 Tax=Methylocella tundrae TaxID=227605 RepID=A0A4U8Z3D3_METTU|nr:hypothetical protein [Methylocella tundrae]WPP03743.1 hypothetical protein SIN04_14905 [Methylocella tundrae]VFU09897.1 protein of unknown function [Methylocella tundrae]